jgi:hypothetical protein
MAHKNNFRGRIPNLICTFLVPLLHAEVIVIRGHVTYDKGPVSLMTDVPITLAIFVGDLFLELTEGM